MTTIRTRLLMTAAETAKGRYMRAPDHGSAEAEFAEFEASGEVEVGETNLASAEAGDEEKSGKKAPKAAAKAEKPAAEAAAGEDDSGDADGDIGEGDEGAKKAKAKENQINRLKREKAELARRLKDAENGDLASRLANIEKHLQGGKSGANSDDGTPAPDPTDTDKYPLGHLDDRYIEDKLEWLADKKATERADAVLQRQQERDNVETAKQQQTALLEKVDDLAAKGSDLYDDFQENVVEAGMRGDWDLSQATFEAAHEAENGAQILYELSQDTKEAARVAKLSAYGQLKFVAERDAELSKGKQPRKIPKAGEPPQNTARGANSRTQISPATDNLDDFEKAWEADAKKGRS